VPILVQLRMVPNLVTMARLLCIPLFVWILFGQNDRTMAALLLAALGATDWIDGRLARRLGQVSELGKILDPTADRLMFLVAIIAMMIDHSVPLWFAILSLVREGAVGAAALVLGAMGARRVDVTWLGKCATFGLMFAFPLFLAGHSTVSWHETGEVLAWICGVPSLVLSYYTVIEYIPIGKAALAEGRRQRLAR
jgi:cardiolipin synthase